jgi:glutathione S-transferase
MVKSANGVRLYVILGSHACRAAMLMLEHKGLDYRTVTLPTGAQRVVLRPMGFPGRTVPALKIAGHRVQTNREIARSLDQFVPEPPLFPLNGRAEVEEAERFADEVLQPTARRLVLAAGMRDMRSLADRAGSGRLGPLLARRTKRRARIMRIAGRFAFKVTDEVEQRDLASLPWMVDRVDSWMREGVLGGERLNAADLQIAPSLCLLGYRTDIAPAVERSRAWELVDRLLPAPGGTEGSQREHAGGVRSSTASLVREEERCRSVWSSWI